MFMKDLINGLNYMNNPEKMTISPKGVQIIYKDGATQIIDNEGNQTITNAKLSPHQEPVATQKEEKKPKLVELSKCCNVKSRYEKDWGNHHDECTKCGLECEVYEGYLSSQKEEGELAKFGEMLKRNPLPTQEPMEEHDKRLGVVMRNEEPMEWWIKEFDTIFVRDDGLINKYTYDTLGNLQNTASAVEIFISKVIKQAEERERERIVKKINEAEVDVSDESYCLSGLQKETIINIITNQ